MQLLDWLLGKITPQPLADDDPLAKLVEHAVVVNDAARVAVNESRERRGAPPLSDVTWERLYGDPRGRS